MVAVRTTTGLVDELDLVASALETLDLRVAGHLGKPTENQRDHLVRTIRSYLIPRFDDPDTPLSIVFAGPTGAGKSTLVNSVSGIEVSKTGPIRPTTSDPVVLTSAQHETRFSVVGNVDCEVVVGKTPILERMALVDTPDIDSTSTAHRVKAELLIDNADLVVFVTSAMRYADMVPWEVLRRASSRGAPIIHVLNRVSSESAGAGVDFKSRLASEGFETEILRIPEHHIGEGAQAVPSLAVKDLTRKLVTFVNDQDARRGRVLDRVLDATLAQARHIAATVAEDQGWVSELAGQTRAAFSDGASRLTLVGVGDGLLEALPPGMKKRRQRRWLRRRTPGPMALLDLTNSVISQISAAVVSDLRHRTLVDGAEILRLSNSHPGTVTLSVSDLMRSALAGWAEYVARITGNLGGSYRDLATARLLISAAGARDAELESLLFGAESEQVVGRAQRELMTRLEIVVAQVGERLVDLLDSTVGNPHSDILGQRLISVVARSHFSDA